MTETEVLLQKLRSNRENHLNGNYNCIPFESMPRLEHFLPGAEKSTYTIITSNSGTGKSKLTRALFVHLPIAYAKVNPNTKVDILYFSLEESKEKIYMTEMCRYLHSKYDYSVSVKELQSVGRHNILPSEVLDKLDEAKDAIEHHFKNIHVFDDIRNGTGIYKTVRDFAYHHGAYHDEDGTMFTPEEMEMVRKGNATPELLARNKGYATHHPDHYVFVIVDHISLLSVEKETPTLKLSIDRMSNYYALRMRDVFGFSPVFVQQQAADKEKNQFTNAGQNIYEKLEPSLDGLGDSKTTQRDANVVLGLFAPNRYGMMEHNGYDIDFFRDNYRSLSILKSRDGTSNIQTPLFFNGAVDFFTELPKLDDEGKPQLEKIKTYLTQLRNSK